MSEDAIVENPTVQISTETEETPTIAPPQDTIPPAPLTILNLRPRFRYPPYHLAALGPARFRGIPWGPRPRMHPPIDNRPIAWATWPPPRMAKDAEPTIPPVPPGIQKDIWEWFFNADSDKDGCITSAEVQKVLLNGKWSPFNEETCKMMVYMMDVDKTGYLDAYELSSLWEQLTEWKDVFDKIDEDKTGALKACNVFKALEAMGYRLSSEFCDAVVARFDENKDGMLSFDDFIQTCIMLRSLTQAFKLQDTNQEGVINLHFEQFLEMVLDNAIGFNKTAHE